MPDLSLAQFTLLMGRAAAEVEHAVQVGIHRAANVIKKEAQAEIGTYQGQVAQFAAWPELADATKADRRSLGYSENEPLLREGTLRDSIKVAVGHHEAAIGSDSDIAVYQEIGTSRIPPRSFLGGAAARKVDDVVNILGHAAILGLVSPGKVERIEQD